MAFDLVFFAVVVPTIFLAGLSKGGFGGGADFLATLVLALVIDPGFALGMMLPLLMLVDLFNLRSYWRQWDRRASRLLILGGIPGVFVGMAFWKAADPDLLRGAIGVIALLYVAFSTARTFGWIDPAPRDPGTAVGLGAGFAAGFGSFISHAGGPPVAVYLLARGMAKTAYQATFVIVFWAINLLKAVPYAFLGIFSAETLRADLVLAPVILTGAAAGVWAHRRMSDRLFFRLTLVLLAGAGLKLLRDALV